MPPAPIWASSRYRPFSCMPTRVLILSLRLLWTTGWHGVRGSAAWRVALRALIFAPENVPPGRVARRPSFNGEAPGHPVASPTPANGFPARLRPDRPPAPGVGLRGPLLLRLALLHVGDEPGLLHHGRLFPGGGVGHKRRRLHGLEGLLGDHRLFDDDRLLLRDERLLGIRVLGHGRGLDHR